MQSSYTCNSTRIREQTIVRIREQELFVYVNTVFVYVHFGRNTPQFARLQTRIYAKNYTSTNAPLRRIFVFVYEQYLFVYKHENST